MTAILGQYENLLKRKRHISGNHGIEPVFIPDGMFEFQKYITEYAIRKGRCAGFIDTGLGKTYIQMVIAQNYAKATGKPVLIITPLAVAFQFIKEAAKFGIDDIEYSKDGKYSSQIVVCNYERLSHFKPSDFDCVILDESSILKNFEGAIKNQVTSFLKLIKYRFLFTATPSPNDFVELGTSSEALGYLGYTDMLTKFFTNNENTIDPQKIGVEWVLKGHARENFFRWVSGWSISMRKPSDLGFDDSKHILPKLTINDHAVTNRSNIVVNGQAMLFPIVAKRQSEIQAESRATIKQRCEKAVDLASHHERTVYWCNLNPEGDLLEELDTNAVQIYGSMNLDKKEEILLSFSNDEIKKLITKPKITAFGLNWQHCNHTVAFPTFSYEKWYQLVRRFWRFGQQNEVTADRVYSNGQIRIIQSLDAKAKKADELFTKLNASLHQDFAIEKKHFNKPITLPSFLSA